jgi:hypothetical protein
MYLDSKGNLLREVTVHARIILSEVHAFAARDPNFNEHSYLREEGERVFGYQPVRVSARKNVWTYSCSDPKGRTFKFDDLPVEIREKVRVLQCTNEFQIIPDVGMRMHGDGTSEHYWLAMPLGYGDPP